MEPKSKIIEGESFTISQPYEEGHVLTVAEARALNQLRSENIGNNLRKLVKEAKEKGDTADLAARVADYDSKYTFAMPGAASVRIIDPVEREARALAKEHIKVQLAKANRKLSDIPADITAQFPEDGPAAKAAWEEKLEAAIVKAAGHPDIIKAAKARVAQRQKSTDAVLEGLEL